MVQDAIQVTYTSFAIVLVSLCRGVNAPWRSPVPDDVIPMSHRNVQPHVSINEVACYRLERTLMGCADPLRRGVGAPHQCSCSRVSKKRSGWGEVCHVPLHCALPEMLKRSCILHSISKRAVEQPFDCDDVTSRAHVSRKPTQKATAPISVFLEQIRGRGDWIFLVLTDQHRCTCCLETLFLLLLSDRRCCTRLHHPTNRHI